MLSVKPKYYSGLSIIYLLLSASVMKELGQLVLEH